jgi:hypothetical protein
MLAPPPNETYAAELDVHTSLVVTNAVGVHSLAGLRG